MDFKDKEKHYFNIIHKKTGRYIDGKESSDLIYQGPANDGQYQEWWSEPTEPGYYKFYHKVTGKCIDGKVSSNLVYQHESNNDNKYQEWSLQNADDGYQYINHRETSRNIDGKESSNEVYQHSPNDSDYQKWKIQLSGNKIDLIELLGDQDNITITTPGGMYLAKGKIDALERYPIIADGSVTNALKFYLKDQKLQTKIDNYEYRLYVEGKSVFLKKIDYELQTDRNLALQINQMPLELDTGFACIKFQGPNTLSYLYVLGTNEISTSPLPMAGTFFAILCDVYIENSEYPTLTAQEDKCFNEKVAFAWQITGAFFLATGLGGIVANGQIRIGISGILSGNPAVMQWINNNVGTIASNKTISFGMMIGFLTILYDQGLLWSIVKEAFSAVGWIAAAYILSRLLTLILAGEVLAVQLLASFTIWATQTVQSALALKNCNQTLDKFDLAPEE